ncbi:MAG: putative quinol monooxygenase [Sulfitobacter sp.]
MSDGLFVFAEITPKPEHLAQARAAILGILDQTRAERGCRSFDVLAPQEAGSICLFEEWEDQAALDAHYAQPYTAAVFASYQEWLAKPPMIKKMHRLGA